MIQFVLRPPGRGAGLARQALSRLVTHPAESRQLTNGLIIKTLDSQRVSGNLSVGTSPLQAGPAPTTTITQVLEKKRVRKLHRYESTKLDQLMHHPQYM